ncbi:MAG TPA: 1,4-alpha-glucan branching protein domain-containing protein [Tepidisphaeraceae bacterium]
MADELGCLCIVLHGHLPFVLNHGTEPHGEAWLFEAAAETYLPLLRMVEGLAGRKSFLTVGITPVLLEQLRSPRFGEGFREYLRERAGHASRDAAGFEKNGDSEMLALARQWVDFYHNTLRQFDDLAGDIVSAFGRLWDDGIIQILTSAATHAYLPLLMADQSIEAQIKLGVSTTRRYFGKEAKGIWLPECAYRPRFEQWKTPVAFETVSKREGLEKFLADNGLTHFFIDSQMVENGEAMAAKDGGQWHEVDRGQLHHDARRGWRQQLSPVGVVSQFEPPRVFAFARHPLVSEQIWSATVGYPGAAEYLDFHRRHGERGLRYHRVTDQHGDLGNKKPYVPGDVAQRIRAQAEDFCHVIRRILRQYRDYTGGPGVVTAPFDAELFGHWWFEGPMFLRQVIEILSDDPEISLSTPEAALEKYGCDKAMRLPDGSWGKYGNNSTWFNDRSQWMWEVEYRAEAAMVRAVTKMPWRNKPQLAEVLIAAARQLLLMQASDWPFVIHSGGAVDYGIERFAGHATAFDQAMTIAKRLMSGDEMSEVQRVEMETMRLHDDIFEKIDLNWWERVGNGESEV